MAGNPVPQRVLVVDDVDDVRSLVRRVLSAGGYEVDVAATLAEARAMDPGRYDAVLVDAHLGAERGMDLVDEMRSANPAAAGRCLVMTGGASVALPDGVACLLKPFQLGDLRDAVGALLASAAAVPNQPTGPAPDPGRSAPASAAQVSPAHVPAAKVSAPSPSGSAGDQRATRDAPALLLLAITRRLRARERDGLVDFLHDGPLQDLTAANLALHMMRRSASAAAVQALDAVLSQLDAVAGSLRWLVEGNWPFLQPEDRLAVSLRQRTAWLLATPVTLDTDEQRAGLDAIDVPAIVDVVELMLLAMVDAGSRVKAHVAVRIEVDLIQIELTLSTAAPDREPISDPAKAQSSLDELASALQTRAQIEPGEREWRVRIELRDASA